MRRPQAAHDRTEAVPRAFRDRDRSIPRRTHDFRLKEDPACLGAGRLGVGYVERPGYIGADLRRILGIATDRVDRREILPALPSRPACVHNDPCAAHLLAPGKM